MLRPDASVAFSRARMLASDGRCKTFSADADGYGRGEGAGIIVLKRLSDAVRAGDRIHAVILGSAVNHNGQSNGIAAPSTPAQEALRSEEHTSELQSLMRISYAVFCLKKKTTQQCEYNRLRHS